MGEIICKDVRESNVTSAPFSFSLEYLSHYLYNEKNTWLRFALLWIDSASLVLHGTTVAFLKIVRLSSAMLRDVALSESQDM